MTTVSDMKIFCVTSPKDRVVENLDVTYARFCTREFLTLQKISSSINFTTILPEINKTYNKMMSKQVGKQLPYVFYSPSLSGVMPLDWNIFKDVLFIYNGIEELHLNIYPQYLFRIKTRLKWFFSNKTDMEFILDAVFRGKA